MDSFSLTTKILAKRYYRSSTYSLLKHRACRELLCFCYFFNALLNNTYYLLLILYNVLFRNLMKYFTNMTASELCSGNFNTPEKSRVCSFFFCQFFTKLLTFITVQTHLGFVPKPQVLKDLYCQWYHLGRAMEASKALDNLQSKASENNFFLETKT